MLQYFNTSWAEITQKMPELAEAGYTSLWLPPPTKGSGGLSVGYDLWDRFDLGSKDQRGSVRTRYGTEAELLRLVETAHRFGIRVYFDNIMNHNAFDIPGFNADTPIDIYPGFVPEDFHLRETEDGFYRKWDNTRNWGDAWQVIHLGLSDLIDIAQEPGEWNNNFGPTEGSIGRKIKFLRNPDNPEYYAFLPNGQYVGFGPGNGITAQTLQDNAAFYSERVEDYLNRSARWLIDRTKADGLRLDAVKHVRDDFFGADGVGKDASGYGYTGQVQEQFNITRGFSDWNNHRDTVFDTEKPRDDAMLFGEHLGEPPGYGGYIARGQRLVDNPLRNEFNDRLGNPSKGLTNFDKPGWGGFSPGVSVMHAQSHDSDYAARRELQHAFYFTRAGLGLVYTDGNYQAETLGQSGGAFPRHANTAFLGQWDDPRLPNLVTIHQHFARGDQKPAWADNDYVAYERLDNEEGTTDADRVTMLIMLNDNYAQGHARPLATSFPSGAYLYNYSTYGGGFYKFAWELGGVVVPPGGYFVFSYRSPEQSDLWSFIGGSPLTILQNGQQVGTMSYERKDGPNGDPGFNPYGLPDPVTTDYRYTFTVPRVTSGTNLTFVARADGSAEDILFKLDAGMDLNGMNHPGGDPRDFPPGMNTPKASTDVFLGYESTLPENRLRHGPEKFAAKDTARCQIGSAGASTFTTVIGSGTVATTEATATNDYSTWGGIAPSWVYHDPAASVVGGSSPGNHYRENAGEIAVWAKVNVLGLGYRGFLYYTTDGSFPEGAGGIPVGTTKVSELGYSHNADGGDWWSATVSPKPAGTFRYKIAFFKISGVPAMFPSGPTEAFRKKKMLTTYSIPHFNAQTAQYRPHNDYGITKTGLEEGFHIIRARAFLARAGKASIYNTFQQTFYYDTKRPEGEIRFPAENDTLSNQEYGVVVRADPSVTEVWYQIADSDPDNDDAVTGAANGNGNGFEPYTDSNRDGQYTPGEPFEDLNGNSTWDSHVGEAWIRAAELTPTLAISSTFMREFRFNYANIPSSGAAQIKVRLRELTSSARAEWLAPQTDAAGHFTTLVRNVTTAAPPTRMFTAFPGADGETIGTDYKMKVYFSKSLADGLPTEQLLERFLIRIASSESGALTGAVTQARSSYQINYDATPDYHELQFPKNGESFPNLFNGFPDFLHTIQVTHTRPSQPLLTSTRQVKFFPSAAAPYAAILNPPELDAAGRRFEIVLPDIPSPAPADRRYTIQVETDLSAQSVSIGFVGNTGTAALIPAGEAALSGVVSVALNGTALTGTGTRYDEELSAGDTIKLGPHSYSVSGVLSATSASLASPAIVAFSGTALRVDQNPATVGNRKRWNFLWENVAAGSHTFIAEVDTDGNAATAEASVTRNTTVLFRQRVAENPAETDDDDDGVTDFNEFTAQPLPNGRPEGSTPAPKPNPETWTNGEVHAYYATGRSNPLSPDSDGDRLPDGLELGYRLPTPDTNTAADTNGDGVPNFIGDLDPPFYNTLDNFGSVPGVNSQSEGGDRASRLRGSMTDPNNPDTDGDGIPDGIEDANRNGWIDGEPWSDLNANGKYDAGEPFTDINGNGVFDRGDGEPLPLSYNPYLGRTWPNGARDPGEFWTETDPINADTDGDGLSDGFGEDKNFNGFIDGDTNGNRIYNPGEAWTETDPLRADTDGDGLPDGWEVAYGLSPLDNGTDNLRTTAPNDGDPSQGTLGDPDGDLFDNLTEFSNGTDPRTPNTAAPPPAGSITIGPVPEEQKIVVGGVTQYAEFTDWKADDVVALDEYEGGGSNNQGGDTYPAYDGFDSSRDIVAFYTRDGGPPGAGGDGNFYFRVDFQDLRALAEQANLDVYVVVDTNSPGAGERKLPDDVDTLTNMRWEAVVAVYSSNDGRVYVDTKRAVNENTTSLLDNLMAPAFGIVGRDQNTPNGFNRAYFNHELDAVEFSISRQALLDAGWNGLNADELNFQVFTTRDGTNNTPSPGLGDIGGRSDIRDSISDDWIAEDYYNSQSGIAGDKSILYSWVSKNGANDRGRRVKVASVIHGNQAIVPGSTIQAALNTAAGAGYYRPLDAHQAYAVPFALHATPTLAAAAQWAAADPASPRPYRDGPTFNARVKSLVAGGTAQLLASTFSDHILAYFTDAYNADNVALAGDFLDHYYGSRGSSDVFWNPERVADSGVLQKVANLGYGYTFVDQMRHVFKWFGRTSALGDDGYRIQLINGVKCFVINDQASSYRFLNADGGLNTPLRELFNRKARSGTQDQVVILYSDWADFTSKAQADAYERNIRWMASRPWIHLVTPQEIAAGKVDLSIPPDGIGDTWGTRDRGAGLALPKVHPDWLHHATQENYDHWYFGSPNEIGLAGYQFPIRPGVLVPQPFGLLAGGTSTGIVASAWQLVASMNGSTPLGKLGRGTAHAANFLTAFHDQANNDLSKFSTGTYIYPDTDANMPIAAFARHAQSQFRFAATHRRVEQWAAAVASGSFAATSVAAEEDVDLDGENEPVLYNDRVFAVFERIGGRMVGAWVRDPETGLVSQAVGNPLAYSGSDSEEEGETNVVSGQPGAFRTSGFKDWFAQTGGSGTGTPMFVNALYSAVPAGSGTGWSFTAPGGAVAKTVVLHPRSTLLRGSYTLSGSVNRIFVRHGFSPDLYDLLRNGQTNLFVAHDAARGEINAINRGPSGVRAFARFSGGPWNAAYNAAATDRDGSVSWDTIRMRNQAQTFAIELEGASGTAFAIGLQSASTNSYDSDGDALPDYWEDLHDLDPEGSPRDDDATGDPDGDSRTNAQEWVLGTDPKAFDAAKPGTAIEPGPGGRPTLRWDSLKDRKYQPQFRSSLASGSWQNAGPALFGTGGPMAWTDDGSATGGDPLLAPARFYRVLITRELE